MPSLEGSDRETPCRQLSSRFLAGMDHNQGTGAGVGGQQAPAPGWSLWGNDPMQTGTPNATSGGRRLYTQDSYKEDEGGAISFLLPSSSLGKWISMWGLQCDGSLERGTVSMH